MSTVLISTHLYEKRPLKKPKLGPPDVYPQDPKQKEDELTPTNVKQGYSNSTLLTDEYGTARNANITSVKFGEFFSSILAKKHELNTFTDTSKKKHVTNKDSAIHVTAKTKNYVEGWFKDLASNTKSLAHLSKKVPFFNKKEEIFVMLYEYSVPMIKAQWLLKLSNALQMAMSESNNKSKKRQIPDPSQEWTFSLCKFLKEHYLKILDNINPNNMNNRDSCTSLLNQPPVKLKELLNQWSYYTQMARFLYEEGLLDRHDFLTWMLELFEKIKSVDDPILNLLAPMLVQYVDEFTQSEFLSRHLSFHCAKKINQIVEQCNDYNNDSAKENNNDYKSGSTSVALATKPSSNDPSSARNLSTCFKEILSCSKYRELSLALSTVIQVITLDCPTAMVWHNFDNSSFLDSWNNSSKAGLLHGSPLDYLPCEPSNLPIAPLKNVEHLRGQLRNSENLIRHRSANSEKKWFFKTFELVSSPQSVGNVVNRLLDVLDCLDKHLFDKVSSSNSLDTLYNKIFNNPMNPDESNYGYANNNAHHHHGSTSSANHHHHQQQQQQQHSNNNWANKTLAEIVNDDMATVKLLCEWAVTTKRLGEYRSRIVAKLLDRRQTEILNEKENCVNELAGEDNPNNSTSSINPEDKEISDWNNNNNNSNKNNQSNNNTNGDGSKNSATIETDSIPIYQQILFEFLDSYAPVTEDKTLGIFFPTNTFANNCQADNKQAFNNLVLLFSELIRHDVFSHDVYMCTLISRGHFVNSPNISLVSSVNSNHPIKNNNEDSLTGLLPSNMESVSNGGLMNPIHKSTSSSSLPMFDPLSNNSNLTSNEMQLGSHMFELDTLDEDKLDEDLDKLLQNIKAGQQSKDDQNDILLPDAMESDKEDDNVNGPNSNTNSTSLSDLTNGNKNQLSEHISPTARHLLYTLHFPLPSRMNILLDKYFVHQCNQRHILLYGVGKTKDEARHIVKKVTKEIQKLFNRKTSMDISDGGKVKKHIIKEGFNFELAIAKFQNLSIFDQQVVTNTCATAVLEMLNGVVVGSANHLPLIESIAFLFDLMEIALNVNGLVEFIVHMLKELVEVEQVLQQKCSILARPYTTSIGLYIVGVLNRYHNYVVASTEDILQIFDGLSKLVRHVSAPKDCSSAERCIFFYLDDLNSSCMHLLKKYQETISPIASSIKKMIEIRDDPSMGSFNSPCIMMQYLKNPRHKVDSIHIRQLNDNASDRHSLVFNAICCIAEANDMDYLNELSVLCAELTASCYLLSNEWYNAFQALCNPTCKNEYISLLSQIDIGDRTIYDNLAVFVSILAARRCFGLEDLIYRVFIPSLLVPTVETGDETERKARLCCHLILYLFKYYDSPLAASHSAMNSSFASSSRYSLTSPGPLGPLSTVAPTLSSGQKSPFIIKYACDRYLLGGALNSLRLELILTLLKAIFVLGTQEKKGEKNFKSEKSEFESLYKPMSNEDDFGDRAYISQITKSKDSAEKPSLSDFAKYVLRQVCLQDWVHDRCLRGFMIHSSFGKLLFDKKMSFKDSQCLLNMICYHKQILPTSANVNEKIDSKQITHIFQNLDEWSLRISWLQLHLNYENLATNSQSSEMISWHDTLAPTIVDYFQQSCQTEPILNSKNLTLFTSKSSTIKNNTLGNFGGNNSNERIWLLKPLICKLPTMLQSKILRVTANLFDSTNWILYNQGQGSIGSKSKSGFQGFKNPNNAAGIGLNPQNPTSTLLSYQPFVSLLLMCLNSKEDHKESILRSMHSQLSQCINEKLSDDIRSKNFIQEGLQLRLSLIGAIFDSIKSSASMTGEWVTLLSQLISFTIVDPHINYVNFATVLDMLTSLMHHSHVSNVLPEQREETKKLNQNLIKKLKKELNIERIGLGVRMARQLLPLTKHLTEVITCEAMGSLVDTKGNKIAGFDSIDKKQGFQAAEKQKLSPWDLIEGHKNSAPLSWTWFGAIKMERKPLRMEENFVLLARHDHSITKPISFYLEPPPIPPEDEPPVQTAPQQQPQQQQVPLMSQTNNMPGSMTGYQNPVMNPNMSGGVQGAPQQPQPSPHLGNMQPTPQSMNPAFNTPNGMHQLHQQSQPQPPPPPSSQQTGPNVGPGYQYMPMNPMAMNPTNIGPHGMQPTPTPSGPNVMHSPNVMVPSHSMMNPNNEPLPPPPPHMNQPHPGMMNSINNPSMMSMPMDIMDHMAPGPAGQLQSSIQSGQMPGLRPNMPPGPMPMPPNVNVTGTRAQAPKKPKAVRKRRTTKQQQAQQAAANAAAANVAPMPGQGPNSSIRMPNSFDNFNSNSVNNQNTGNAWPPYQQHNQQPPQSNNIQSNNQQYYHQTGSNPNQSGQSMMMPQQRFSEQSIQNPSKVRLRAMLNTRHPNSNQFNQMNQNETPVQNPVMNPGQMMNNQPPSGPMIFQQSRHPMPQQMMQQQKAQIRSQGAVVQQNQPTMVNQNQMFQQQQQQQQINPGNSGPMHHHMAQQQSNFGAQQNAPFNNMQTMDNSMPMSSNTNYQPQQQPNSNQQSNMMLRAQMQPMNPPQSNQAQFIQQRSQFSNFGNHQSQQQQQQQQQMLNNNGQHWSHANQMGPNHRAPMTQLQRQLSAPNQGQLQGSQTPYPYG